MDEIVNHICLHETIGITNMKKSNGKPRLAERLENEKLSKKIVEFVTFGLGLVAETVLDAANLLLKRDYPSIANFGDENIDSFGTVIVPEIALPGVPKIFDVEQTRDAIEKLTEVGDRQTANKLKGDIARQQGDTCEMNLLEALKGHYDSRNAIVINGLKMLKLDGKPGQDEQEIDIIVVDYDLQIIWNIESKKKLDFARMEKSSAWKAKLQLQNVKEVLEDWFDTELQGDWQFGSALYTEDPADEIKNCAVCSKFIGYGPQDLVTKLQAIEENLKLDIPSTKPKDDLLNLAKFMLYCCPKSPLPTTGNLSLSIKKAIDAQGSAENILVHFFPTQQQLSIEDDDKMAICGCWGCGKSGILTHEAIRLAKKKVKVIFLVFISHFLCPNTNIKTFFIMDLEEKMKKYSKFIKVQPVLIKDGEKNNLIELTEGYDNVIIDEGFSDIDTMSQVTRDEFNQMLESKIRVWLTLSNFNRGDSRIPTNKSVEDKMKDLLPRNFKIVKLTTPLRMSHNIAYQIKDQYERAMQLKQLSINERLIAECNLPPRMVNGFPVEDIGVQRMESLFQNLKDAFGKIPNSDETPVLFIINDSKKDARSGVIKSLINCKCGERIHIMAITFILRKIGRPCPLFLSLHHRSPENEIKKWMSLYEKRDCIASLDLTRGFEFDHIVNLSGAVEPISRAIVQFIWIRQNWFLTALTMKQLFLKIGHKCDQIFDELINGPLTDFDHDDFSIIKLIDENLNGYTRSKTLPGPNHYIFYDINPILYVLADQARYDGDFPEKMNDIDILDGIIKGLQNKTVEWPEDKYLLPLEGWIEMIQSDMSFYSRISRDAKEFQAFDHQMVQLCANFLKRSINLIPFPEGKPQIFHPRSRSPSTKSLNILSCNTAYNDSFTVSIFQNPKEESSLKLDKMEANKTPLIVEKKSVKSLSQFFEKKMQQK